MRERPKDIEFLEVIEDDRGTIQVWADVGGHEIHFTFPRLAFEDRKLAHGLAEIVIEYVEDELESDAGGANLRVPRETSRAVVDLVPDADDQAMRLLLEEHLDRFEDTGHDWHTQEAPLRISQWRPDEPLRNRLSSRPDLKKKHKSLRARTPERRPVQVRRIKKERDA